LYIQKLIYLILFHPYNIVGSLARLIFRTIFIKPEKAKSTTKIQNQDEKILE